MEGENGEEPAEGVEQQQQGPGAAFGHFTQMEEFLDKVKLLGYDRDFLKRSSSYKPLSKNYFSQQTNTGEQFFMFTNVTAWLIQKAGNSKFDMPQEHDDPNATISNILDEARKLEVPVDFPPNKLKTGSGEHVLMLLDKLADAALHKAQFSFQKPSLIKDDLPDVAAATDEAEITGDQLEEEEPEMAEDDDEEEFLDLEGLKLLSMKNTSNVEEKKEIMQSDTDASEWKLEVERVTPSLKVTIRQDAKDWRNHLEQMQVYRASIDDALKQAQSQLERLSNEIGKNVEKIQSREKYLNTQLESILSQFRSAQDRMAEVKEKYKEASVGITERSRVLAQITEELEQTKQDLEERGLSLTDGAPLVKIKQALTKLQQEMVAVDVEIGVIEQSLLQAQLRDRTNLHYNMHSSQEYAY